eukprot:4373586-Amphidinium_carterae.1
MTTLSTIPSAQWARRTTKHPCTPTDLCCNQRACSQTVTGPSIVESKRISMVLEYGLEEVGCYVQPDEAHKRQALSASMRVMPEALLSIMEAFVWGDSVLDDSACRDAAVRDALTKARNAEKQKTTTNTLKPEDRQKVPRASVYTPKYWKNEQNGPMRLSYGTIEVQKQRRRPSTRSSALRPTSLNIKRLHTRASCSKVLMWQRRMMHGDLPE